MPSVERELIRAMSVILCGCAGGVSSQIRKTIGLDVQNNFRGILTDGFLSVKGVEHGTFFALGDCATIEQVLSRPPPRSLALLLPPPLTRTPPPPCHCALRAQPKLLSQAEELFKDAARVAPYDPSHTSVTLQDLKDLCNRKLRVYPQVREGAADRPLGRR